MQGHKACHVQVGLFKYQIYTLYMKAFLNTIPYNYFKYLCDLLRNICYLLTLNKNRI